MQLQPMASWNEGNRNCKKTELQFGLVFFPRFDEPDFQTLHMPIHAPCCCCEPLLAGQQRVLFLDGNGNIHS